MENIIQTGLIVKEPSKDSYKMGGVTGIPIKEINSTGEWKTWLPSPEIQDSIYNFDTMSCVSFSASNVLEVGLGYMIEKGLISQDAVNFLHTYGYFDSNGKVNFSDRFTAIMSGTTKYGNDFETVWNSIRKNGLIPEAMFPFGGTTFDEYHNKSGITPEMIALGQKFLGVFEIMNEWVFWSSMSDTELNPVEVSLSTQALKQSPLHVGSPIPASHALMQYQLRNSKPLIFDSYGPFDVEDTRYTIFQFAMKGFVQEKVIEVRTLKIGMKGDDVKKLQTDLNEMMATQLFADGDFGKKTLAVVIAFQKKYGLVADGVVGKLTRTMLANELAKKKS